MSVRVNAVQVQCDWCGTVGPERPMAPSGIIIENASPEGWTAIGYGSIRGHPNQAIELKDAYGSAISNLCPACSQRPVGDLLTYLGALPVKEESHGDHG